jgi:peptide/nickel transport system substrate-binding protein
MQFAAKRDFMVSEILVGYGAPMLSAISSYDPDWPVVADVVEELGIKDDLTYAKSLAEQALIKAGAVKGPDGKWRYGGEVVKIKFFIRADDAVRFQYGESFAAFLADLGFEVEKEFRWAMQFAAKRDFMVKEILAGYGTPMLSAISS